MPAETPTVEPKAFSAGETVVWNKELSDYPSSDWTLVYYLVGSKGDRLSPTVTTNGTGYTATFAATNTAGLTPGTYKLFGRVSAGGAVYSVYEGTVEVSADPSSEQNFDLSKVVSHARKCRDALRALMEKRATIAEASYTIFGERSATLLTVDEALKLLAHYEAEVAKEEKEEALARGERTGIYIRFRQPR